MYSNVLEFETPHFDKSWLKAYAPRNVDENDPDLDTLHFEMSSLNEVAVEQ